MFPISLCTQYATHTLNIPISNHSFSKDNWALYPSLLVEPPLQNANRRFLFSARHHFMRESVNRRRNYFEGRHGSKYRVQYRFEADLSLSRRDCLGTGAATPPCWHALATAGHLLQDGGGAQPPLAALLHQPPHPAANHVQAGKHLSACAPLTHPPTTRSSSAAGGRDLCNQL